jgi:hypothetical protein
MQHNPGTDCPSSNKDTEISIGTTLADSMHAGRTKIALAEPKNTGPACQDCTGRVQRYRAHLPGMHMKSPKIKDPLPRIALCRVQRYRAHLPGLYWQSPKIQGPLTMITLAESKDTGPTYQDYTGGVQRYRAGRVQCPLTRIALAESKRYRAHLLGLHWPQRYRTHFKDCNGRVQYICTGRVQRCIVHLPGLHWQSP